MNNIEITCPKCGFQIDSKKELEEFEVKAAADKAAAVAEAEERTTKQMTESHQVDFDKEVEKAVALKMENAKSDKALAVADAEEKAQREKAAAIAETKERTTKQMNEAHQVDFDKEVEKKAKEISQVSQEEVDKLKKENEKMKSRNNKLGKQVVQLNQNMPSELKGAIQEEVIEDFITKKFKSDRLEVIERGKNGADSILHVIHEGEEVGKLKIESKDTKTFSNDWQNKLLDDMIKYKAKVGLIISKALPSKFPMDQGFETVQNGIALVGFKYEHIHSVIYLARQYIILSHRNKKSNMAPEHFKKCAEWIQSPNFANFMRKHHQIIRGLQKHFKDRDEYQKRQSAKDQRFALDLETNLRDMIFDLECSVGEEHIPQKLIKYNEDID